MADQTVMADDLYRRALDRIAAVRASGSDRLSLEGLRLDTLPPEIGDLTGLRTLDLDFNRVITLPDWIGNLKGLQVLYLSGNGLSTLPDSLGNLTGLQILYLSGNGLSTLPDWIGNLTGLRTLDLSENELSTLPNSLRNLTNLQTLDLSENELSALPNSLGNLTNLRSLDFSHNGLSVLPDWIGKLAGLQSLYLSGNGLSTLPDWIGNLTGLQSLYLGDNGLSALPDWLKRLTSLQSLYLNYNRLSTLPDWIGKFKSLQSLSVGYNGLSTPPNSLGNLTGLRTLDLSGNGLSTLPAWIENLTDLQSLDLSHNKLSALPDWLGSLAFLEAGAKDFPFEGLNIANNPLPHPYPLLIEYEQPKSTTDVLAYLRGELDPTTFLTVPDGEDEDDSAKTLAHVTEQRPAAYRFGLRDGRIDALPESAEPIDPEVAADLLTEIRDKTRDLTARLAAANADPRVRRSVDRLHEALTDEPLRPGILLSRARSIEADRDAFDTPQGRAELFPDAIAQMNDVLLSLQDVLAVYPVVRRIDAERLALEIQSDAASLAMIAVGTDDISAAAAKSDIVTTAAAAALTVNDAAIADATTLDVRAGLVADKLLVVGNLTREAIRAADRAEAASAETLPESGVQAAKAAAWAADPAPGEGLVAGELGRRIGREILDNLPQGVGDVARIAPIVAFTVFLSQLLGPVGLIAGVIPAFKPLVGAAKSLRSRRSTGKPASVHEAAMASPQEDQPMPPSATPSRKVTARKGGSRKTKRP